MNKGENQAWETNKIKNYTLRVCCSNCGFGTYEWAYNQPKAHWYSFWWDANNYIEIPRGKLLKDMKCPNCGIKALK